MLTGIFDYTSTKQSEELTQLRDDLSTYSAVVQTSHILNESTMQDIDPSGGGERVTVLKNVRATDTSRALCCPPSPTSIVQTEYAVSAMSILRDFGLESIATKLLGTNGVHDLGNLLSLATDAHGFFDRLELWFESTNEVRHSLVLQWPKPNAYKARPLQCLCL